EQARASPFQSISYSETSGWDAGPHKASAVQLHRLTLLAGKQYRTGRKDHTPPRAERVHRRDDYRDRAEPNDCTPSVSTTRRFRRCAEPNRSGGDPPPMKDKRGDPQPASI